MTNAGSQNCVSPSGATGATAVTMEILHFHPAWLAMDVSEQMKRCPYHPEYPTVPRGDHGPGRRCLACSRCLPVRYVLMAKLMHHPMALILNDQNLRLSFLFYLDREGLGKLCQTARTQANHVRIDVASLDPALHWERKWKHRIEVRN